MKTVRKAQLKTKLPRNSPVTFPASGPRHTNTGIVSLPSHRDIFLSHRSTDKKFVRQLAADIENTPGEPKLYVWLDEAEIRPGFSIPKSVNDGLEKSRLIGLIMTPDYFSGDTGWTDAEWHSMLHIDPDNRQGRIIPLISADCPYVPFLLRHLYAIDLRSNHYDRGLTQLVGVLRNTPLPRPTVHRGQLVTPGGKVDRALLFAERAVPSADPDAVNERLYCNLLPVERLPQYVTIAPIAAGVQKIKKDGSLTIPSKESLRKIIKDDQVKQGVERPYSPAFRIYEDKIFTFHESDGPISAIVDTDQIEVAETKELLLKEETRNIIISLFNMAISRHAKWVGLEPDHTKIDRYFFPSDNGGPKKITWKPKEKTASRMVAKPWKNKTGSIIFWIHQGAYIKTIFLANKLYLQIRPTWVVTTDGLSVMTGSKVTKYINRWTSAERNLQILYHLRFWTTILRKGRGLLSVRAGDQTIDFSTLPAFVDQAYGIKDDNTDVLKLLDQKAEIIAREEEELIERLPDISVIARMQSEEYLDESEPEEIE